MLHMQDKQAITMLGDTPTPKSVTARYNDVIARYQVVPDWWVVIAVGVLPDVLQYLSRHAGL